jgi:hypothetical protein
MREYNQVKIKNKSYEDIELGINTDSEAEDEEFNSNSMASDTPVLQRRQPERPTRCCYASMTFFLFIFLFFVLAILVENSIEIAHQKDKSIIIDEHNLHIHNLTTINNEHQIQIEEILNFYKENCPNETLNKCAKATGVILSQTYGKTRDEIQETESKLNVLKKEKSSGDLIFYEIILVSIIVILILLISYHFENKSEIMRLI